LEEREETQKLHGIISDLAKEVKMKNTQIKELKRLVFAFENQKKLPEAYACDHCHKQFTSRDYLRSHVKRRHSVQVIPPQPLQTSSSSSPKEELREMIELIMNQVKEPHQSASQLEQEKLKFESELQQVKANLYREIEEEKAILRQDREAFEKIIESKTTTMSRVGELEEDEESKRSRPPSRLDQALKTMQVSKEEILRKASDPERTSLSEQFTLQEQRESKKMKEMEEKFQIDLRDLRGKIDRDAVRFLFLILGL
jgi:hypothetical protein